MRDAPTDDAVVDTRFSLQRGDHVWFRQTSRGGYGFQRDVPAIYCSLGASGTRATIEVPLVDGRSKRLSVLIANLRRREVTV